MENAFSRITSRERESGSVLIIFALSLLVLMGLAALAVDLGAVYAARTQLQAGADAAALAAVQELDGGEVHMTAAQFASLNSVMNTPIYLGESDVITGQFDFSTGEFAPDAEPPNAVKVRTRRTPDSPGGPFELFFGKAIGFDSVSLAAESIAAVDSRVAGVDPPTTEEQYDLLPFAVDIADVGHLEDLDGGSIEAVDFEIDYETGKVTVLERVDLEIQVVGSAIVYGAGGPTIPVYSWVSLNDGASYDQIAGGAAVSGGETLTYEGVDNAEIAIKGRAYYTYYEQTYFDSTRYSNAGTPYVIVLKDGDICPEYEGFDGQDEVTEFLTPYLDADTREITIGQNDVIFLFEFASNLYSGSADFQDLVVLCTFNKVETELARSETRFIANVGEEITFYPFQDMEAPGNFGLVSLDGYSNGTSTLRDWIMDGYPESFVIPTDPGYLELNGRPGFGGGIKQAVQDRQGDTVLVTVYDSVEGEGNNAWYRIPYFLAVEITDVHLTGAMSSRYVRGIVKSLQTTNLITEPGAPEHADIGRNRMAR